MAGDGNDAVLPAGLLVAVGVALAGWFIGDGFVDGRRADRYVTVKGLAEREVAADLVVWPLGVTAAGDALSTVQARVEADLAKVRTFLTGRGIASDAIETRRPQVTDLEAQTWGNRSQEPRNRFIVRQQIVVRSNQVDLVRAAAGALGDLVKDGVVLTDNQGPFFAFTRLNEIKPDMIAQATRAARDGAERFAEDSDARVGDIRKARQGLFTIQPRDGAEGLQERLVPVKKVRVVSTIDFYLED